MIASGVSRGSPIVAAAGSRGTAASLWLREYGCDGLRRDSIVNIRAYHPEFRNGDSSDTVATEGTKDGLGFNADVSVGPYSIVMLSPE